MPADPLDAARPLLARLATLLADRPDLRREVAGLARAVADWADGLDAPAPPAPASEPAPPPPAEGDRTGPKADPTPAPAPGPSVAALASMLSIRWQPPPAVSHQLARPFPENGDLDPLPLTVIAKRCRVKSDGAKLVADRQSPGVAGPAPDEPTVRSRADALPDCKLWMLEPPTVTAPRVWADLAGAFAVAADAAELLLAWEQSATADASKAGTEVLALAAEAQSTLLYAVADVRMVNQDYEQVQLFVHVREAAKRYRIFVHKFLKREDRPDPANWSDVGRRVRDLLARLRAGDTKVKSRQKAIGNLRFKLSRAAQHPDQPFDEWPRVYELIDELAANGVPPSNVELRDLLLPVLDRVPDEPPPPEAVTRVFREIDAYLASRPEADGPAVPEPPSADVAAVAGLLRGREMVLIGGQVRPHHRDALTRAFELADLRWLSTPEHTSFTVFEPDIARPEVAVVLLAIRWTSHSYAEVRQYCTKYGKLLVRLPRGYNANQVAHEILSQAGDRLRGVAPAE